MKRSKIIIAIVVITFCILTLKMLAPIAFRNYMHIGWSDMWCEHQDVDINSGKIRYTKYFWHRKTNERIEKTLITEALTEEYLAKSTSVWVRVYTFVPGIRYSPSYRYHSAILRIRCIERDWATNTISDIERQEIAENVVKLWHENKRDF